MISNAPARGRGQLHSKHGLINLWVLLIGVVAAVVSGDVEHNMELIVEPGAALTTGRGPETRVWLATMMQ